MAISDPPFVPAVVAEPTLNEQMASYNPVFSQLPAIPTPPSLDSIPTTALGYLSWGQTLRYSRDRGLRAVPVAAPQGTALVQFHRVHSGVSTLLVEGLAIRVDQEPDVSSPAGLGDNAVQMTDEILTFSVGKLPDGSPVLVTAWRFLFIMQAMLGANDYLSRGGTPLDTSPAGVILVNPALFVGALLGPLPPLQGLSPGGPINY